MKPSVFVFMNSNVLKRYAFWNNKVQEKISGASECGGGECGASGCSTSCSGSGCDAGSN